MQNITIGRFETDDTAQGAITPGDKSWQLVIDKDGYPHLYVRTSFDHEEQRVAGLVLVEDWLPEGVTIRSLMEGETEPCSPADEERGHAEWLARRDVNPVPCPRP